MKRPTSQLLRPSALDRRDGRRPKRPAYRAARAFFITLAIGLCLATWVAVRRNNGTVESDLKSTMLVRRGETERALSEDEECRLVRSAKDQCAFVKKHCPTDEGGFATMLDLFYCQLSHVKPLAFLILVCWLGLLFSTIGIAASDFFCINLSTIAAILGMSESMAGVTFLAFGNGSPDVFSTFAAMSTNSGSLAVGELFGAAGFITAVVAGSMALIRPFQVAKKSFVRDVGFFALAAGFSMFFLWDGRLHFWECAAMVAYYIFYVIFVVCWHWWLGRRRWRREKEALARSHFINPIDEHDVVHEEYHDDVEDRGHSRSGSVAAYEDWSALEQGVEERETDGGYEDDEEQARERWMGELSSNMRLTRPSRSRANTMNPVRPSLVGALEFQAVLKSLQKSRNIQTIPMYARRYSDDPVFTTAQQQEQMSTHDDPAARPPFQVKIDEHASPVLERSVLDPLSEAGGRQRAVSMGTALNDSERFGLGPSLRVDTSTRSSLLEVPSPERVQSPLPMDQNGEAVDALSGASASTSHSPLLVGRPRSHSRTRSDALPTRSILRTNTDQSDRSISSVPHVRDLPRIVIPKEERVRFTPTDTPATRYRDVFSPMESRPPSLHLPEALLSPESVPADQDLAQESDHPIRWWPYKILPAPQALLCTLFPTISLWHEKNWWEKMLGIVAAPSVFLLTITLPVVENDKSDDHSDRPGHVGNMDSSQTLTKGPVAHDSVANTPSIVLDPGERYSDLLPAPNSNGQLSNDLTSNLAEEEASRARSNMPAPTTNLDDVSSTPIGWNRWLTMIQLFLSPIFTILAVYIQSPDDLASTWLIKPILISIIVSTMLLIPFIRTTTPSHRPAAYRIVLSLVGFIVSIAWISTIASQVVGALKALAIILNMSHAIMGLTIFAVGNSLGDLVADITVARLGYPVMALSACFGGPLLNILLGVGLSGCYIMINGVQHRQKKHPHKDIKFKSYEIEVSNTLIVSGATLLLTLVGLLIAVPMNGWVMSKRIGWALIILWTVSTVGNVVLEVAGYGEKGWEG